MHILQVQAKHTNVGGIIMTQEEKELLLKDLCGRLPYGIKIQLKNTYHYHCDKMCNIGDFTIDEIKSIDKKGEYIKIYHNDPLDYEWYIDDIEIEDIKPYLHSMSSMTEEELNQLKELGGSIIFYSTEKNTWSIYSHGPEVYDWLNAHHFDYRGLIEKGLAIEAPENIYKDEKKI